MITVGVSLKMYLGHRQAQEWCAQVAERAGTLPAVAAGEVTVFVMPSYLAIPCALETFAGTAVRVGAQDVATADSGPYTGEVSAAELAEAGVDLALVGHAERRGLFGETDHIVAAKTAAAIRHRITPVLCVGEPDEVAPARAAALSVAQLSAGLAVAPAGPVVAAYEPVWAIGAPEPASVDHIATVACALRRALDALPEREGSTVIYGGAAGPACSAGSEVP